MMKKPLQDNRGLTLLELIIGIVILAIVVTPLLHAFVTGANSAKKNKQYNDATVAAQNIVEDIEATDLSEYLAGSTRKDIQVTDEHGYPVYTGKNKIKTYPEYLLCKDDVESGGTKFDAVITADGSNTLNDSSIPVSNSMDAQLFLQEYDSSVFEQYTTEGGNGTLHRRIVINIDPISDGAGGINTALGKISVQFNYTGTVTNPETDKKQPFEKNITVSRNATVRPDSTGGGNKFAAFVFFQYYPTKANSDSPILSSSGDTSYIVINNNTDCNVSLYLINTSTDTEEKSLQVDPRPEIFYYTKQGKTLSFMSNMTGTTCKVFDPNNNTWMTSSSVPVNLAETTSLRRLYNIKVDIYKDGQITGIKDGKVVVAEGVKPVATLTTSKLDYSIK